MPAPTVWILGDQLLARHPALPPQPAPGGHVLLIESRAKLAGRPYNRQKLTLLLSAMRHYAADLTARGYAVDYRRAATFSAGLDDHIRKHRPDGIVTMAASSYNGRVFQQTLRERLGVPVTVLPNTQFLIGRHDPFPRAPAQQRIVMERFYRAMRRHFDVLMDGGEPAGGQWNFDKDNRRPLPPDVPLPPDRIFPTDDLTAAVLNEVGLPVGSFAYAVTRDEALAALAHFITERLPNFGPYEDAITTRSHSVFHSVLSPYLNLGLLEPLEVIHAAEEAYRAGHVPINSAEGFIRQILGWREYMAWHYWRAMPGLLHENAWAAQRPLPGFFWDGATDMACLAHVLRRALDTGYTHHIERLMVLTNFLMLAGVEPQAANEWFMSVYVDAHEWVMPPNVIGMGLNADGGIIGTKPYIASANYINRMGDRHGGHCAGCRFRPDRRTGDDACPYNFLYWNFLLVNEERLRANPRFGPAVLGLRHLDARERAAVQAEAARFLEALNGRRTRSGG